MFYTFCDTREAENLKKKIPQFIGPISCGIPQSVFGLLFSKPMFPLFLQLPERKVLNPNGTHKYELDKNKKFL